MQLRQIVGAALLVASSLLATGASGQTSPSLSEVQRAYAEVDYDGTRGLAIQALKRGGHDRATTAALYLLWATAAAALDHADEAKTAFSFALAASPELRLDKSLSPKIRAPYLEARGSLSGADGKPPLEVTLRRRDRGLELALHDPLQVAESLELATRAGQAEAFVRRRLEPAPRSRVATPEDSDLQLFVHVLDRHGNVLFELGSADEPLQVDLVRSRQQPSSTSRPTGTADPTPYYATAGALAVLGLGSGGIATAMYLRREDAAREWNGPECERTGLTRGAQCAQVDERRQRAETFAIGFAAAGGALLLGSLVTAVLAPSRRGATTVAVSAAPGELSLQLGGRL